MVKFYNDGVVQAVTFAMLLTDEFLVLLPIVLFTDYKAGAVDES